MSFLAAVKDSTSMVQGDLTYFKPFVFGVGLFEGPSQDGFLLRTGYAIPWTEGEYILGAGLVKELMIYAGYRNVIAGDYSIERNKHFHALTLELALVTSEWLNKYIGLEIYLGMGVNYWQTQWKSRRTMEPMLDLAVGLAF